MSPHSPASPLPLYVEPFVYTSTETKFGQTGYQLLVRGGTLLDPEQPEYAALVTVLKQAGQVPVAEGADPALVYVPVGSNHGVFISVSWIRDWRGRPGAAASGLVFPHADLSGTTAAELAGYFRANPQLFMGHARALRAVEEDHTSQACPIVCEGITLQLPGDTRLPVLPSDYSGLLAAGELVWTNRLRLSAIANEDAFQRMRGLLAVAPSLHRFATSLAWNAAGDLSLPAPAVMLWRGESPERADLSTFPPRKPPGSPEAKTLLQLFKSRPDQLAEIGSYVVRQGGGKDNSPIRFWSEIIDEFNIEQVLEGERYLQSSTAPKLVAQSLDALRRRDADRFDQWIAAQGSRLFGEKERFLAILDALFTRVETYRPTLLRIRDQMPGGLQAHLNAVGIQTAIASYADAFKTVEPMLLPAFVLWLESAPPPPPSWDFLARTGNRAAWAKAIARQPAWLDAALTDAAYRQVAEALIADPSNDAGTRERVSRHFWSAAARSGDPEAMAWALKQPSIVAAFSEADFAALPPKQREQFSERLRQAAGKGLTIAPATCWALLRSPVGTPDLRQAVRDCMIVQAKNGDRFTEEQLVDFIKSANRDIPHNIDNPHYQSACREINQLIRLHLDIFRDLRSFEDRFLGMTVKTELERFNCDRYALADAFSRMQRPPIAAAPLPSVAPGERPLPPPREFDPVEEESWLRRHASVLVGAGGLLVVTLLAWAGWRFWLSPEARAERDSAALQEMRDR